MGLHYSVFAQTYEDGCEDTIEIPQKKHSLLAKHGLIGIIHLESHWSEEELLAEVCSVFSDAMEGDVSFPFTFLSLGGGSKTLTKPIVSATLTYLPLHNLTVSVSVHCMASHMHQSTCGTSSLPVMLSDITVVTLI